MSELKITGRLIKILPIESGVSKAGKEWSKQDFFIETEEQFSKQVCFTLFGDKMDVLQYYKVGDLINVSFNVQSREYNGKYFHNINAWKLQKAEQTQNNIQTVEAVEDAPPLPDENNDLPF